MIKHIVKIKNLSGSVIMTMGLSVFMACSNQEHASNVAYSPLLTSVLSGEKKKDNISSKETVEVFKECVDIGQKDIKKLYEQQGDYKKAIAIIVYFYIHLFLEV